jgi:hypothetical protein
MPQNLFGRVPFASSIATTAGIRFIWDPQQREGGHSFAELPMPTCFFPSDQSPKLLFWLLLPAMNAEANLAS